MAPGASSLPKSAVQQHLDKLDSIFGPEYFEHGRLVVTVARDLSGCMKVATKLMSMINERYGAIVEVLAEHVKHEWWVKLAENTTQAGMAHGGEIPEYQVTDIPDGIRIAPYARERLPTLEFLLLWEDTAGHTRGHCLFSMAHPQVPTIEQVDDIFGKIEPFFAKRWIHVELKLGKPIRGEFEEPDPNDLEEVDSTFVGADVTVAVLALHPFGHATNVPNGAVANVSQCVPISFFGLTDDAGIAKLCFIPADINKIQVSETERFHGLDRQILKTEMADVTKRSTDITLTLTPKAQAAVTVHVFALPETLPESDDTGLIDWSAESRQALPRASVELTEQKDGGIPYQMDHVGEGRFVVGPEAQAEGFVCLKVTCEGYKSEERFVMLLVGSNEFYIPLQRQI